MRPDIVHIVRYVSGVRGIRATLPRYDSAYTRWNLTVNETNYHSNNVNISGIGGVSQQTTSLTSPAALLLVLTVWPLKGVY